MFEDIVKTLAAQIGIDRSKITENSDIVNDLGADSLDVFELLMTLEENTGKTIPEDKINQIKTVGDLVKVLETL